MHIEAVFNMVTSELCDAFAEGAASQRRLGSFL